MDNVTVPQNIKIRKFSQHKFSLAVNVLMSNLVQFRHRKQRSL